MIEAATQSAARFPRAVQDLLQRSLNVRDRFREDLLTGRGMKIIAVAKRDADVGFQPQTETGKRTFRETLAKTFGESVHVFNDTRSGRDELASRAGDSSGGGEPQGVGWQPDVGWSACAIAVDVSLCDVRSARVGCIGISVREPEIP